VAVGRRTFWHGLFEELSRFLFVLALKNPKADVFLSNPSLPHELSS
jgi:hypothetical protein